MIRRLFASREPQPPTIVQFFRHDGSTSMPVQLGYTAQTIRLAGHEVAIRAGEKMVIAWPRGCEVWSANGVVHTEPRWWRPA